MPRLSAEDLTVALDIVCPLCGEEDDLFGESRGDVIAITSGACGRAWDRPTVDPLEG